MTTQYSTAQKLCLAGMLLGGVLSGVGGCAPYWLVLDTEGFGLVANLIGKVISASMGPFLYCYDVAVESDCYIIGLDIDKPDWLLTVRITTAICVMVSTLCALCALCLACCSCCQRLIVLGIMAFLAACSGAFSAVVFSKNTEVFTQAILGYQITSYGWAFYVFCAGLGLLGLVSFVACLAAPDNANAVHGMVMSQPPPTQLAIISPSAPPLSQPLMSPHPHTVIDTTGY